MPVGGVLKRLGRGMGIAALATWAAAGSGCIIVVDESGDHEYEHWRESRRTYIGVTLDSVSRETAAQLELDRERVALVSHVYAGTPAERAGLLRYDVITSVDGSTPASPSRVRAAIRDKKPGESLSLGVVRAGKPLDVVVVAEEK